jgi:hypothetical protein
MRWLVSLNTLNLIDALNYYLIIAFVQSTVVRIRNYRAILGVIFTFSDRWPKLLMLEKRHRIIFLHWPTLLPIASTLALMLLFFTASHFVWSYAKITPDDLVERWWAFLVVTSSGVLMVFMDCKAIFGFGYFDRASLEKELDQAEHWLQSWQAPVLRFVTFGLVNPRKIVNRQVREAIVNASLIVNGKMWSWSLRIGMRLAFGLVLWATWALVLR